MKKLLEEISASNQVELDVIEQILEIEHKNVYKKRRVIFGDLKQIIEDHAEAEVTE